VREILFELSPFRTSDKKQVAYCSELSWLPSGPRIVKRGDRTVS
jgi:hypothetical protein